MSKHQWHMYGNYIKCSVCGEESFIWNPTGRPETTGVTPKEVCADCPGPPKEKPEYGPSAEAWRKLIDEMREAAEKQDAIIRAWLGTKKEKPGLPEKFDFIHKNSSTIEGQWLASVMERYNALIDHLSAREKE